MENKKLEVTGWLIVEDGDMYNPSHKKKTIQQNAFHLGLKVSINLASNAMAKFEENKQKYF